MTSATDIEAVGRRLFGPRWRSPMAEALRVDRHTLYRWMRAGNAPDWVEDRIARLPRGDAGRGLPLPGPPADSRRGATREAAARIAVEWITDQAQAAGWPPDEFLKAIETAAADVRRGRNR